MMLNLDGNYNPAVTAVAPTAMPKAPPTFVSAQKKTQRSLFSQAQVDHYSLLIDADEGRTVNLNDEVMKKDDNDNSGEIDEILDHTWSVSCFFFLSCLHYHCIGVVRLNYNLRF